jgi:serine phosphatase RsbU (regulator of sigma subunit)
MHSLFHHDTSHPAPSVEPVPTVFPSMAGADIAAVFVGKRVAGDFYDSIRVSPERILFGLLDVAGRREENRGILRAAQQIFRTLGPELFSRPDLNESNAMTELSLRINRGLIETSTGVHPCPAFIACYHEGFGTLCYTNAGHTSGLLRDSTGTVELPSTGLPLGLFSHATCDAPTIGMEKGAALLLVSRGVVEFGDNHQNSEEGFGLKRIMDLLQTSPACGAPALCVSIMEAVDAFVAGSQVYNDRTALALIRTA